VEEQVRSSSFRLAAIALIAGSIGCASAFVDPGRNALPAYIKVQNDNWLDINVYAVRWDSRFRLGTITGLSTGYVRLPDALYADGSIRLLADPIGSSETYLTETIPISRGEWIEFSVHNVLRQSYYAVWHR
jgi:hypothetical protein